MPESPAFIRSLIRDDAVTVTALVIFRQVLSDGHAVLADKQQAMAIFVNLHFVASADPTPLFGFSLFIGIKVARTQGFAEFVDMSGQAENHRVGDGGVGVHGRAALLGKTLHILPHFVETCLAWLSHPIPPAMYLRCVVRLL